MTKRVVSRLALSSIAIAVFGASVLSADCNNYAADGVTYHCSMTFNGRTRTWVQYIPTGYVSGNGLFLGLHGAPGNGDNFEGSSMLGFSASSGANFIYLAPDGGIPSSLSGSFIWEINDLSQTNSHQCSGSGCANDTGFLRALIQRYVSGTAAVGRPLDPDKVYVGGHSEGAEMTLEMAVTSSDLVAAVLRMRGCLPILLHPRQFLALQAMVLPQRRYPCSSSKGNLVLSLFAVIMDYSVAHKASSRLTSNLIISPGQIVVVLRQPPPFVRGLPQRMAALLCRQVNLLG